MKKTFLWKKNEKNKRERNNNLQKLRLEISNVLLEVNNSVDN